MQELTTGGLFTFIYLISSRYGLAERRRVNKDSERSEAMLKHLLVFAAVSMGTPVMAANKVTGEGTLEHGSGGEYIGQRPQCWLGSMEEPLT